MNILNDINNLLLENTKKDNIKKAIQMGVGIPLGVIGINKVADIYHNYIVPAKMAYNISTPIIKNALKNNVPE